MVKRLKSFTAVAVMLGVIAPVAHGQTDPAALAAIYSEGRSALMTTPYAAKARIGITQGTGAKPAKSLQSFDTTVSSAGYTATNVKPPYVVGRPTTVVGTKGQVYVSIKGEPDAIRAAESATERVVYHRGSPIFLPDAALLTGATPVEATEAGTEAFESAIDTATAQRLLAYTFASEAEVDALAPKLEVERAVVRVTVDVAQRRIVTTNVRVTGVLPKEHIGEVSGLWIVGEPVDQPVILESLFSPTLLPRDPAITVPKRTISLAAWTSTVTARNQIVKARNAIEKYGKRAKTVAGMTPAAIRKIDKNVKLVAGRGTTKAGTVGYTILSNGRRYSLRVTAANGWTYTATRPFKGKFTTTCVRPGGASCGTW